eukprot:jgi/Chlat1/207/Chrsp1S03121
MADRVAVDDSVAAASSPAAAPPPATVAAAPAQPQHSLAAVAKSLLAGGVAGGVSRSAVAPLERLKILFQVQDPKNPKYTGIWQGLRAIWRSEGLRGFFKGNGANCARIIPNSAVKFYSYEQSINAIVWAQKLRKHNDASAPDPELTPALRLYAGATAGIIAMSATYPLEMVRGRLSVQADGVHARYRGLSHACYTILKEEGFFALYKGWLPSVIGVVPYVGLNFAVYETLKDLVLKTRQGWRDEPELLEEEHIGLPQAMSSDDLGVVTRLACGAVAGSVGQTVAYPLDVVRRRMQVGGWQGASRAILAANGSAEVPSSLAYNGMIDCFQRTVREEGWRALYKGLWTNYVKVVPSIAIAFVTYEQMKRLLGVDLRISE